MNRKNFLAKLRNLKLLNAFAFLGFLSSIGAFFLDGWLKGSFVLVLTLTLFVCSYVYHKELVKEVNSK